jgi:O-antigen/teichoic acid export membrane protein
MELSLPEAICLNFAMENKISNSLIEVLPAGLSLRTNFSWIFAGNIVYAGCQWGMLVVLTKLGSPEMVGQFALGLAVTAPIMLFANLRMRAIQATDARRDFLFRDYLGLRLITTLLAWIVIASIGFGAGYRPETGLVILIMGLAKGFEAISDIFYGLLQRHERMDRIAKSMMLKGILSLLAFSSVIYLTASIFWGAVSLAGSWAVVLINYDIRSGLLILNGSAHSPGSEVYKRHQLKSLFSPGWVTITLVKLAWLALPLGLVATLISLRMNIPNYFIERYLGESQLGIYASMAYLIVAGNTVAMALGEAASPRLAKYYAAGDGPAFRALLLKLVSLGALLGGAGILVAFVAGREILTLLYRSEYAAYSNVLIKLIAAAGIDYVTTFLEYGMTAARYFRVQMPLIAVVTLAAALGCLWLIPQSGLSGAATAVLISTVIRAVGSLAIVAYALKALYRQPEQEIQSLL